MTIGSKPYNRVVDHKTSCCFPPKPRGYWLKQSQMKWIIPPHPEQPPTPVGNENEELAAPGAIILHSVSVL